MPDLIDLIYQTATDARQWPQLIQRLTEEISREHDIPAEQLLSEENSDSLQNHFKRALQINQRIRELEDHNNSLTLSLNFINLPVILIDSQQRILESNQHVKQHFQKGELIDLKQPILTFFKPRFQTQFQHAFQNCLEKKQMQMLRFELTEQNPISLNIIPMQNEDLHNETYLVLFANQNITNLPSAEQIQATFSLTKSESELAHWITTGIATKLIAEKMRISYHTCRTHLKNIYIKTGTHSQSELSYKVFTDCIPVSDATSTALQHPYRHVDHQMRLKEGRTLSFAEYGPIQGDTVFYMHTIIGSRKQIHPDLKLLYKYNIRLIIPERPGIGLSSPKPERTLHDWVDDMKELITYLKLRRFSLIGWQMGAEYALVCAQYFPKQLKALHLIGMRTPPEIVSPYPDPFAMSRMMLTLANKAPKLLQAFFKLTKKWFLKNPEQHLRNLIMLSCPEDKALLKDQRLMAIFIEGTLENSRHYQSDAIIRELQLVQQPWQIEFDKIKSQVHIWHSRHDPQFPFAPVETMMPLFSHCQTHIFEDDCVMLALHRWPEILQVLRHDFDQNMT